MAQHLTAQQVDEVPQTATVSDYDELLEDEQAAVRRLVDGESVTGSTSLDSDVVRFTGYYRIERRGAQASD